MFIEKRIRVSFAWIPFFGSSVFTTSAERSKRLVGSFESRHLHILRHSTEVVGLRTSCCQKCLLIILSDKTIFSLTRNNPIMTRRVLEFTQMVKSFKQGVFLCFRRIHRIFKSQFHSPSRLSSLTLEQWVGRHATLRGRCSCLPTRYYYTIFDTLCQGKNLGAAFPPHLKRRGFHAEEIDD